MSLDRERVEEMLRQPLPISKIRERKHDGVNYIAAHDVERRLNEVFGHTRWSKEVMTQQFISCQERATQRGKAWVACYRTIVRLRVPDLDLVKEGESCSTGQPQKYPEDAHDQAVKSSASDALKRAAKMLGDTLGLALYADPNENWAEGRVVDDTQGRQQQSRPPAAPPAQAPQQAQAGPHPGPQPVGQERSAAPAANGALTQQVDQFFQERRAGDHHALILDLWNQGESPVTPELRARAKAAFAALGVVGQAGIEDVWAAANHGALPGKGSGSFEAARALTGAFIRHGQGSGGQGSGGGRQ